MKNYISIPVCCIVCLLAYGCSPSYYEPFDTQFSPLNKVVCDMPENEMYLFFSGENLDFDYLKVGVIEVEGTSSSSKEDLLDQLKNEARNQCANGLVNITSSYKTYSNNGPIELPLSDDVYSVEVITAIAVIIDQDEKFISKHQVNGVDVSRLASKIEARQEKSISSMTIAYVGVLFIPIVLLGLVVASTAGY